MERLYDGKKDSLSKFVNYWQQKHFHLVHKNSLDYKKEPHVCKQYNLNYLLKPENNLYERFTHLKNNDFEKFFKD